MHFHRRLPITTPGPVHQQGFLLAADRGGEKGEPGWKIEGTGEDAVGRVTAQFLPKDAFLDRVGGWVVVQLARRYLELAGGVSAPRFLLDAWGLVRNVFLEIRVK